MEHVKLESITDSPAFWNDPYSISSYCNSILQSTRKENEEVSIVISDYNTIPRVSYEKRNSINKYCIYLPKLKDFYIDHDIEAEDIKLRKAFLKHELAHIVYSDMESYVSHHSESLADIRMLANAIEDVRIENFFGKRFPGANDTFFEVQNKFYKKGKNFIEKDAPSMRNLALYFLYRSKRFNFEKTLPIEIYDAIFEKHKDFLSLSNSEIIELLSKIKADFEYEVESKKEDVEDYSESLPEKKQVQMSKEDFEKNYSQSEEENDDVPQTEIEIEEENKPPQNNVSSNKPEEDSIGENDEEELDEDDFEDSTNSEGDSESESDLEDSETDSEEDFENEEDEDSDSDSDGNESNNSGSGGKSDSSTESDFEASDFSDMIKEEMQSNLNKEKENLEDFNSDNKPENFDFDSLKEKDSKSDTSVINILKNIDFVSDQFINEIDSGSNNINDFLKYNNSKMKNHGAKVVDISRYINLISNRKVRKVTNRSKRNKVQPLPSNRTPYSIIAAKNNKNIISLTNFFKLKFQGKEKSRRFYNKEVGDLNNESLYKLFNEQEDNKIFSNIEKSIVTKEDVSFLLDFSGSMGGSKIKCLFESLVVLNEVFTKIKIPYNIFSFTGRSPHINIKYNSLSEKSILSNVFNPKFFKVSNDNYNQDTLNISGINGISDICFCLINRNSKSEERKKIINFLLNNAYGYSRSILWNDVLFGGGTPEIQSMIALYNTLPKQKLFLINDGEYDKINFFGKEIDSISQINNINVRKFDIYKFGYNLISGKEVSVRTNSEKNLFMSFIRIIYNNFTYGYIQTTYLNNFFNDGVSFQQEDLNTLSDIIYGFKSVLSETLYNKELFDNKDFKIEGKYFTLEKKYNPRTDVSVFKIITKILPDFKLKVYKKVTTYSNKDYYSNDTVTHDILLDKDEINDIKDIYKIYCYLDLRTFGDIIKRNDIAQYTYLDLVNKMRNSGWSVFGIGIDSDYGRNYIGDSNFTYVRNYGDIRENLEKKIKKIIN